MTFIPNSDACVKCGEEINSFTGLCDCETTINVESYKKQMEHLDDQISELESTFKIEIIELQTLFLQEHARHAAYQGRYYHPKEQVNMWVEANDHLANPEIWRDDIEKKRKRLDKIRRLMDHVFGGKI